HSQGEIAAACVAGALTLADAAKVVAVRARMIGAIAGLGGGMVSVPLPVEQVRERISGYGERVAVAAVNGPAQVIVSGDSEALEQVMPRCAEDGVRTRRIQADYASHSAHMECLRPDLEDVLAGITPRTALVPMLSTVTGRWLDGIELDNHYWYTNLRATVGF